MNPKRYPRQLSRGANNAVIALSETEVGKLFGGDTRSDIGSEAEKLRFANEVNNLLVRFQRLEYNAALDADMLVMERIYPLDFRAYEVETRELWLDVFTDELHALHAAPASSTATCSAPPTCRANGLIIFSSPPTVCG